MDKIKYNYYHEKFPIVKEMIHVLYDLDGCNVGGLCHVVTDDDNIHDDDLQFVIDYCEKEENKDRIDKELSSMICKIMLQMTFLQRAVLFWSMNHDMDFSNKEDFDDNFGFLLTNEKIEKIVKDFD